jgi:hypothetical protein
METQKDKGGPPDEAGQKRILELMDRMMSLDTAQLKIVMAEIRASSELKDDPLGAVDCAKTPKSFPI